MNSEPLNDVLEKLASGDLAAVEQVFMIHEPYLRLIVRRHLSRRLRAKFDSIDVVQSVWMRMLRGLLESGRRFVDAAHLRAFLIKVTRDRLNDHLRHFRTALEREQSLTVTDPDDLPLAQQPRPSEIAQADELWQKMLALCPPAHHEVLRLKRRGLRITEIAVRTGLHEGSVRRILRKLARQLAFPDDTVTE